MTDTTSNQQRPHQAVGDAAATAPPDGSRRNLTRPLIVLGALAVGAALVLVAVLSSGRNDGSAAAPDDISQLVFITEDGSTGTLADHLGKALVVNFFASWCAPCRAEMPDIEAAHQAYGEEVAFLGVSHDLDETSWRSFVAETEVTYPTVLQPGQELWTELELIGLPATILIDPDGQVVYEYSGIIDETRLNDLIDEHLLKDL
jgi:thiol-disulfide isomerase/thioredoxin